MKKIIEVTAAIIAKDNKIFAARRKAGSHLAGLWEFPGGKLESGETPQVCLKRELHEEFRITTKVGDYVGESIYDYGNIKIRLMAYQVEHLAGKFELVDHDKIRWFELDELDDVEWAPADIPLVKQYRASALTSAYYEKNANAYCTQTTQFDVQELYAPFLQRIPSAGHILDLGCGSGRDSKAFLSKGYKVTAIDGCVEIVKYAERNIEQRVLNMKFHEIHFDRMFDGVWACASLLHCPKSQIQGVILKVARALKDGAIAYMSFKWDNSETYDDNGRYFNNYTDETLRELISDIPDLHIVDLWGDAKPLRGEQQRWVNVLVEKNNDPLS